MRGRFSVNEYDTYLKRVDEKYNLDLDFRNYETFAERDLNLTDLPTAPNAISVAGLALVIDGCKNINTIAGVNKIGIGRGLDLFDGNVARWLDQSSDMGALTDVTCDKLGLLAIAKAAWQEDALPKSYISYVAVKNGLHAFLAAKAGIVHPHESFRPPKSGKYAMLGDNLGGGLLLYANAYKREQPEAGHHKKLRAAGLAMAASSLVPEAIALKTYFKRAKNIDE